MRRATAYRRNGRILLDTLSRTTAGVWIGCGPVMVINTGEDTALLGRAVLEALNHSEENVPHPQRESWARILYPLLNAAGVTTWNTFAKSALCVGIGFSTNMVSFVPKKNLGPKNGFDALQEKTRNSPPTDIEIGSALLAAFEDAE